MFETINNLLYYFFSIICFFLACTNTQSDNISLKRKLIIFSYISLSVTFFSRLGQITIIPVFSGVFFLLIWRERDKVANIISFLVGYLIQICVDYFLTTSAYLLFHLSIDDLREQYYFIFAFIYLALLYFLTRFARYILHTKLRIREQSENSRLAFMILLNLSVCMFIFIFLVIYGDTVGYPPGMVAFNGILFFLYFLSTTALIFFTGRTIQKDNRLKLELVQYENLHTYTREVERLYEEMRKFRHDYLDLLSSMKGYIDQEDSASLKKYFYENILPAGREITVSDSRLGSLGRIRDEPLKSLIAAKLMTALECGIHVNIEINGDIEDLPIKTIDLIRVMGIFLTNATEAAEESQEKELDLAVIREENKTTVLLRNSTAPLKLPISQILQKNTTTKEGHNGIGLHTAREILDRYPNVQWKISCEDDYFMVQINIVRMT